MKSQLSQVQLEPDCFLSVLVQLLNFKTANIWRSNIEQAKFGDLDIRFGPDLSKVLSISVKLNELRHTMQVFGNAFRVRISI